MATKPLKDPLFTAAKQAMAMAHAPYSKFKVGAAILADNGWIYPGCNVENASYPEGVCAETSAISEMVLGGGKKIREIAVIGPGRLLVTPCGGCRQRIREFGTPETLIHICGPKGRRKTFTLGELLPESFSGQNFK
jgi:cytidine deaminase